MRNFVRDVGNQVTLGVFVGTFVYTILAIVSISGIFVPHLSITIAEALLFVDLAVRIYFIHHISKSIQLPEVTAGTTRDLLAAVDAEFPALEAGAHSPSPTDSGKPVSELLQLLDERGEVVRSDASGYLQFVSSLVPRCSSQQGAPRVSSLWCSASEQLDCPERRSH